MSRYHARVDRTQAEIVAALRQLGASVTPIHALGHGVPDLLVGWRQRWYVLEVKDGTLPSSKRQLTEEEQRWIAAQRAPVYVVGSVTEAIGFLTMQRS